MMKAEILFFVEIETTQTKAVAVIVDEKPKCSLETYNYRYTPHKNKLCLIKLIG